MKENFNISVSNLLVEISNYVESNSVSTVEKGNLFTEWCLKYLFERSEEQICEDVMISGKHDNSVDAWFVADEVLYILQAKYNSAHCWDSITCFYTDMKRLIKNDNSILGDNNNAYLFNDVLQEFSKNNKKIEFYYITNVNVTNDQLEKSEKMIEEDPLGKNLKFNIFGIDEMIDYIMYSLNNLPTKYRNRKSKIIAKDYFKSDVTIVAEVPLKEFAEFVKKNYEFLFYSNIRNFLKATKVNKAIQRTFKENPVDFWYYNNGITIICDEFEVMKYKSNFIKIIAPQIVNGCQTANTILNEYIKLSDDERKHLQGSILIKIIQDKNKKRKDEITKYTNNQNAVSGKDFFALELFHKKLKKSFEDIGYYYEIQKKESLHLSAKKTIKKCKGKKELAYLFNAKFNNILPVKEVVQSYAAGMHELPSIALGHAGELSPGGAQYQLLFNNLTPNDPHYFLYPYTVMKFAKDVLNYKAKDSMEIKKSAHFLFVYIYFQLIIKLLKEEGYVDKYDNVTPLDISSDIYKLIFEDSKLNTSLLNICDNILIDFMRDSSIKTMYKDNIPKFLKGTVQNNRQAKEILDSKIDDAVMDIKEDLIKEFNKNVVNCTSPNRQFAKSL